MKAPVETAELLAFSRTVEARSLSRAAAELGIPRATLSRRLARLEEQLGARLLRRTTRSLALTDAGDSLYRHAKIVLEAVAQAEESVRQKGDAVRGNLRVSVPPMQNASFFNMLTRFSEAHPLVRMQVHFSSRLVDLRRDGYDVAIRATDVIEPGLISRTLMKSSSICVASPGYLEKHGTPRAVGDLRKHSCLMGFAGGELPQTHWTLTGGKKVAVEGAFFSNEIGLLASAAASGLGIAHLPELIARPLLESGVLVQVLEGKVRSENVIAVVYAEREFIPPQVRAFVDATALWAQSGALAQPRECPPEKPDRARPRKSS